MKQRTFPKDFLWGASTADHQVEGGNHNQWTEWEMANAESLAKTAEQRLGWLPNWPKIKGAAELPDNYISGRGVEHYERYKDDFRLLKDLRMNAFRFGIEWSRIEPEEGRWDEREIAHYRAYIHELKRLGIEPIPTLWHWTMPLWFVEKGAFEKRRNVSYFERFARKISEEFGSDLHYVLTLNEPNVYASQSYITNAGEWPPAYRSPVLAVRVYRNLARAHNSAAKAMKTVHPQMVTGLALHIADNLAVNATNPANRLIVKLSDYLWDWWFLDRTKRTLDFVGVNFYHTRYVDWRGAEHTPKQPMSDLGWYMEPDGIGRVLEAVWWRYRKPIIITENGLADAGDEQRKWWLARTVDGMQSALAAGVDLRGYLHWSLLDNFEWAFGWWPKFGLVAVDSKTMKRTVRPSTRWFAGYIEQLMRDQGSSETSSAPKARVPKQHTPGQRRGR